MIEPNLINDLPDMIQLAIMSINKPPKAVALVKLLYKCNISGITWQKDFACKENEKIC